MNGETVSVTINGTTEPATIGNNGAFSVVFPTATIPALGTAYTITYAYAGDANLNAVSPNNTSTALTVTQLPVVLSGTRVYDGTTVAVGSGLTIVNNVDGVNLTLSGNGVLAAADVGSEAISTTG